MKFNIVGLYSCPMRAERAQTLQLDLGRERGGVYVRYSCAIMRNRMTPFLSKIFGLLY